MKVGTLTTVSRAARVPAAFAHLKPDLAPMRCTLDLQGVSAPFSNALRRTLMNELPVLSLTCVYEDVDTNDEYIDPDIIISRLKMVPIMQSVDPDTTFTINVTNTTKNTLDIHMSDLVQSAGKRITKPIFTRVTILLDLRPTKYFKCAIRIVQGLPGRDDGQRTLAYQAVSLPVDVEMKNMLERSTNPRIGQSIMTANHRHWSLEFSTHGSISPKDLMQLTCDTIIARLRHVDKSTGNVRKDGNEYSFLLENEGSTIGHLLNRTILDMHPDIEAVTVAIRDGSSAILRIKTEDDVADILHRAIKVCIDQFIVVRKSLDV